MHEKDRKILVELSKNSRTAKTQLAKNVGLSPENLHYRLQNLERDYRLTYYTNINTEALGYERYGIFVQFSNISLKEEQKILSEIVNHPFSTYIGPLIGKWSLVFDIFAQDKDSLYATLDELFASREQKIDKLIITSTYIPIEVYHEKLFEAKWKPAPTTPKSNYKPDVFDMKLLSLIAQNARISYAELSTKLDMSANGIKKRIKNLEEQHIILGYSLGTSIHSLGYETYVLQITNNPSTSKELQEFVRQHPQTLFSFYYKGLGQWDADIGIFVKKPTEVRTIIMQLKEQFGEHLQIQNMYIIGDIIKENVTPEGVFKK